MKKNLLLSVLILVLAACATSPKPPAVAPVAPVAVEAEDEKVQEPAYSFGPLTLEEQCSPYTKENAQERFDLFYLICADICLKDEECAPYTHMICLDRVHQFEDETQYKYYECMSQGGEK